MGMPPTDPPPFAAEVARARAAQQQWADRSVADRVRFAKNLRPLLVEHADALTAAVEADAGRTPAEVVASDVLPAATALKYLHRSAGRVLRPRKVGGRPLWLWDCRDVVYRRPFGVVGLIGTWNYPLFLTIVPVAQALAAGNAVLWKPSEWAARSADVMADLFRRAGVPDDVVVKLPATREAGPQLAEADVDFVHFTGSDAVGRRLAARLGERLIPSVLELSGVDAVFVLPDADVELAARSAWYGATLNGGQTCLACRRAFVPRDRMAAFVDVLRPLVAKSAAARLVTPGQAAHATKLVDGSAAAEVLTATADGGFRPTALVGVAADAAVCREATFAPLLAVIPYDDPADLPTLHDAGEFGLAASVFTADPTAADRLADRLRVGSVVVNDVIVPTVHPATPFGGRRASGWGSTQGDDGLLAMTAPQVVSRRKGAFRPHVDAGLSGDPAGLDVARGALRLTHGRTVGERLGGLRQMLSAMARSGRGG